MFEKIGRRYTLMNADLFLNFNISMNIPKEIIMWRRLSNWLQKNSTGWLAALFTVIFLVFTATVLPAQSAKADPGSEEVGSPDLSFFYSVDELYGMAESYGAVGRVEYVKARFGFDVIWPLVYTAFLVTAISWLFAKGLARNSNWQKSNILPIWAMIFDFFENGSTSLVMARYPTLPPGIAHIAPFFTAIKWILVSGSFILLIIGVVVGVSAAFKNSKRPV